MTVKEAAARLECSVSTVYALVAAGRLGHARIGLGRGVIRIGEADLAGYLEGRRRGATTPAPGPQAPPRPRVPRLLGTFRRGR